MMKHEESACAPRNHGFMAWYMRWTAQTVEYKSFDDVDEQKYE